MTLKEQVLASVNATQYYQRTFPKWRKGENVLCPFHDDSKPSLAVDLHNGGAHCHAARCGKSIGNVIHFEAELRGVSEEEATKALYHQYVRQIVPSKLIKEYQNAFQSSDKWRRVCIRELGLTTTTSTKFGIGVDLVRKRFTIPIYDRWNNCINVRFYRPPSIRLRYPTELKVFNLKGYGARDLFPWPMFIGYRLDRPIFIMASEKETMLAIQLGLQAICSTAGEGSWDANWNYLVAGFDIGLVLDRDKGGQAAEKRLGRELATVAKSIKVIRYPGESDFDEYILKERGSVKALMRSFRNGSTPHDNPTPSVKSVSKSEEEGYPELPELATDKQRPISEISSQVDWLNRRIITQGIVAAKAQNTFMVPWKFRIKIRNRPEFIFSMKMNRELLSFIKTSDRVIENKLHELIGSPVNYHPVAFLPVTEVEIIPTAVMDQDVPYVMQRCYFFGQRIEANVPYNFEIIPTTDLRSQETVGLIVKCDPISKTIDRFEFSKKELEELRVFQPSEFETVTEKLATIANEISVRFTRIYNRLDWHLATLLSWASPLTWRFPNETRLHRGWINTLALGDTETGKSEVVKSLQHLFGVGVTVNAENCTFVGLVGGAIKSASGQLMLRWGRIPISDKQLVVVEELSGLSVDEISNLSEVRSSGMARLDKGGLSSETNARTRLICLSNVRPANRTLASYLSGVQAVQELVGHGEDIARFDMIVTLVDSEVPVDIINDATPRPSGCVLKPELLHRLIRFIWALQADQIQFSQSAYLECLTQTIELSKIYHPAIPIFKGGSGRYKLARIAAAIACFQFSWNGTCVTVQKKHVSAAAKLLKMLYNKPSLGYRQYSEQMFDRDHIKDVHLLDAVLRARVGQNRLSKVVETLIHSTRFNRDELCAIAGITILEADQLIGTMVRERALRKGEANLWEITLAGKKWMMKYVSILPKHSNGR